MVQLLINEVVQKQEHPLETKHEFCDFVTDNNELNKFKVESHFSTG